jgi:predicted transcriptional regulator
MAELLSNMEEPRRLTHILYMSNMSYTQLKRYLETIVQLGLAQEFKNPHRCYSITDNGKTFIDLIRPPKPEEEETENKK